MEKTWRRDDEVLISQLTNKALNIKGETNEPGIQNIMVYECTDKGGKVLPLSQGLGEWEVGGGEEEMGEICFTRSADILCTHQRAS